MRFSLRAKRMLTGAAAGALVLSMLPAGVASADLHGEVCANAPDSGHTDKGTTHADNIDCVVAYGIAGGETTTIFGTFNDLTRGQAATFFRNFAMVATDGAIAAEVDENEDVPFTDIDGTTHETNIEVISRLGLIQGTTATTYSPNDPITRGQFATILFNAHVALGVEFDDVYPAAFTDTVGTTHEDEINALAGEEIIVGETATTYNPNGNVERGQTASLFAKSAGVLDARGLWDADRLPAEPGANNPSLTEAPELLRVDRDGDLVTFTFDENVEGKQLDQVGGTGANQDLFTGLRLYSQDGTPSFAHEAAINGDVVIARFASSGVVSAAVRAGVYTETVQDFEGFAGVAGDFALTATAEQPSEYFPRLVSVGNYRTGQVVSDDGILVDYVVDLDSSTQADNAADLMNDNPGSVTASAFALVGDFGQIFRGGEFDDADASGTEVTVTIAFEEDPSDIPEEELRRGFIEEDFGQAFLGEHALMSSAWIAGDEVNGTTVDPDLVAVERGSGDTMEFRFDQPVDPAALDGVEDLYSVINDDGERLRADDLGRSAQVTHAGTVVIASFDITGSGFVGNYDDTGEYLSTVTAAYVDSNYSDTDETVISEGAANATQVGQSQQNGRSAPAKVLITPPTVDDPTPGVTELPDLIEVNRTENAVTGNFEIEFVFNEDVETGITVEFAVYNATGVQTRSEVTIGATDDSFSFGPNVGDSTFSNEQIRSARVASVADNDEGLDTGTDTPAPALTEGSLPIAD